MILPRILLSDLEVCHLEQPFPSTLPIATFNQLTSSTGSSLKYIFVNAQVLTTMYFLSLI